MQGDWDRRERSTGVSFRRAETKNRQRAGPRRGTGPGAFPTSLYISHPIYAHFRVYASGIRVGHWPFSCPVIPPCLPVSDLVLVHLRVQQVLFGRRLRRGFEAAPSTTPIAAANRRYALRFDAPVNPRDTLEQKRSPRRHHLDHRN